MLRGVRLWSLHPQYLDPAGLVAVWREGLLAQAVLHELTRGYRNHPQLARFREQRDPRAAIAHYLDGIAEEAERRGYRFDAAKIRRENRSDARGAGARATRGGGGRLRDRQAPPLLSVTVGQLLFEWAHLEEKVRLRNEAWYRRIANIAVPLPHPAFAVVPGGIAPWERSEELHERTDVLNALS